MILPLSAIGGTPGADYPADAFLRMEDTAPEMIIIEIEVDMVRRRIAFGLPGESLVAAPGVHLPSRVRPWQVATDRTPHPFRRPNHKPSRTTNHKLPTSPEHTAAAGIYTSRSHTPPQRSTREEHTVRSRYTSSSHIQDTTGWQRLTPGHCGAGRTCGLQGMQ